MKEILFVIGSMREGSFNRQLAVEAQKLLTGKASIKWLDYSDLPYMNQDIEYPAPEAVTRVREQVKQADGVWIFSPEYNYSYPGVLKNLLDWLSRPLQPNDYASGTVVTGKPVAVSNVAGKSTGSGSREKLLELLEKMGTAVMKDPAVGIALSADAWATNRLALSDEDRDRLARQADALLESLSAAN